MLKNLKDSLFVRAYNTFGYDEKNVVYQLSDVMEIFREATKSKKALQLVMITTYGVRQNAHSGIMQTQVRMDDLFSIAE